MGTEKTPSPIDVYVGSRIRSRRTLIGYSQEKLGSSLGVTFQQIQKYERGANRVGSSRLYNIAQALDVPISFFFDDYSDEINEGEKQQNQKHLSIDIMSSKETLKLLRNYYSIDDELVRKKIFDLIHSLKKHSTEN